MKIKDNILLEFWIPKRKQYFTLAHLPLLRMAILQHFKQNSYIAYNRHNRKSLNQNKIKNLQKKVKKVFLSQKIRLYL